MEQSSVMEFFEAYAADLASGDGHRIAANYDCHALFLSDKAGYATPNNDGFAAWFSSAAATYRERGFGDPIAQVDRVEPLTDHLFLVWVLWRYRDREGDPMFDADYVYGLRADADRYLITTVMSLNEADRAAAYLASTAAG